MAIQTVSTVFEARLRKEIEAEIERIKDSLVGGGAVSDLSDYRGLVGRVKGLQKALDLCDAVNEDLNNT